MAEFGVRFSGLENSADMFSHSAAELKETLSGISDTRRQIRWLGSANFMTSMVLWRMERHLLLRALSLDSLSDSLKEISSCYRETEHHVVFLEEGTRDAAKGEVTSAQKRQMDYYMQQEMQELLGEERYSRETWERASLEERKEILNEYLQELTVVMGLPMGTIQYINEKGTSNGYLMGSYSAGTNQININEWVLENGGKNQITDSYELLTTVAHEMRHAYQQAACDHPEWFIVSGETIRSWQESIDNHRNQDGFMEEGMNAQDAYQAYRNQTIERDARWFAGQS